MSLSQDFNEKMQSQSPPPKRETLLDSIERALYLRATAKERQFDILKGSDVWSYFLKLAENHPEGKKCLVKVERQNYRWEIMQILLDAQENPIQATTKAYIGRVITADSLDISMDKLMQGNTCKILSLPEQMC